MGSLRVPGSARTEDPEARSLETEVRVLRDAELL